MWLFSLPNYLSTDYFRYVYSHTVVIGRNQSCLYIADLGYIDGGTMKEILQYLKAHGERFDAEIAVATGIPLETVLLHLAQLAAKGEIITCHSIRFMKEKKTEGMCCRIAGYTPPAAPGRKSKVQLKIR